MLFKLLSCNILLLFDIKSISVDRACFLVGDQLLVIIQYFLSFYITQRYLRNLHNHGWQFIKSRRLNSVVGCCLFIQRQTTVSGSATSYKEMSLKQ